VPTIIIPVKVKKEGTVKANKLANPLHFLLFIFALDRELENIKLPQQCRSGSDNSIFMADLRFQRKN